MKKQIVYVGMVMCKEDQNMQYLEKWKAGTFMNLEKKN